MTEAELLKDSSVLKLVAEIPFTSPREAEIIYNTLRVDAEPRKSGIHKQLRVEENKLHVEITAKEARILRVCINSFFDHVILATNTIDQFGPPK